MVVAKIVNVGIWMKEILWQQQDTQHLHKKQVYQSPAVLNI